MTGVGRGSREQVERFTLDLSSLERKGGRSVSEECGETGNRGSPPKVVKFEGGAIGMIGMGAEPRRGKGKVRSSSSEEWETKLTFRVTSPHSFTQPTTSDGMSPVFMAHR